ncbi:MAG: GNAT family N-acetyltransferase [Anaerolineales bacterium]|nr:GNAT family N-acetyltransferase [Anaerolineales bacterium]
MVTELKRVATKQPKGILQTTTAGYEALQLATALLQRARLADPLAGVWEAADVQWWWRSPRPSDEVEKLFWLDDSCPLAGVLLTRWSEDNWQCDLIIVPNAAGISPETVWTSALAHAAQHAASFDVPVSDSDAALRELAQRSGLTAGDTDSTAWLDVANRPPVPPLPDGFVLVDRMQRAGAPHPLRQRNGEGVAQRLAQCSLYDPALDLAVETAGGQTAGYSLYWFDPVTKVGLVEPVRVEGAFQRKGLALAMLCAGIDRLAARGAQRIKVSYQTEIAGALYQAAGFQPNSTTTWYQASAKLD